MGINREELFALSHYEYGEAFFGSYRGMRFRVALEPFKDVHFLPDEEKKDVKLKATVWPGPYAYAATDRALMTDREFEYSEEGMKALVDWMNGEYASRDGEFSG